MPPLPLDNAKVQALSKAVAAWFVVWVFLVHVFVVWNWDSYSVSPRSAQKLLLQQQQQQQHNQTKDRQTAADKDDEAETIMIWQERVTATQALLTSTTANIQRLQAKQAVVQETAARAAIALDNLLVKNKYLQALQQELDDGEMNPPQADQVVVFADGNLPLDPQLSQQLQELLSLQDLGSIADVETLKQTFRSVIQSLKDMTDIVDKVQWTTINDILQREFPTKESVLSACPVIDDDSSENEMDQDATATAPEKESSPETPPSVAAVTPADVERRLEEIRAAWDVVYEGRPLPVSDTEIKRLEWVRQQLVEEWLQRVQESYNEALDKVEVAISAMQQQQQKQQASSTSDDNDDDMVSQAVDTNNDDDNANETVKCAKTDDVLAILEAGIDAVHRKNDLQEALRQAMSERDGELRNVILDADLPLDEQRPVSAGPQTLRQYLDTAILTHTVPEWIHALVDFVGGHNDEVDKFIDTLPENVGEVAVQGILDAAGQVNLSKIQVYLERQVDGVQKATSELLS